MGGRALVALALLLQAASSQNAPWTERAHALDAAVAATRGGAAEVGALWQLAQELVGFVVDGEVSLDIAEAFAVAVGRISVLPPVLRPDGFDPREFLELAAMGAEQSGSQELQAGVQLRLSEELLRGPGHAPDLVGARAVLRASLEHLPQAHQTRPWLLLALAKLERDFGSLVDALAFAEEATEAKERASPADLARIEFALSGVLAEIEASLGAPDRALQHVRRQEELAGRSGRPEDVRAARLGRIQVHLATGQLERAMRLVDAALDEELQPMRSQLLLARGTVLLYGGALSRADLRSAIADLKQVLEDEAAPVLERVTACALCVSGYVRLSEHGEAREHLARARAWLGDLPGGGRRGATSEIGFALDSAESCLARATKAEGQVLRGLRARLRSSIATLEERWLETPVRPGGIGFLHYANRRSLAVELINLAIALDGEAGAQEGLQLLVRLQGLGSFARSLGLERGAEQPFAGLVSETSGCLLYLPGADSGHVFAVDGGGLAYAELPASASVEEVRRRLVERVSRAPAAGRAVAWRSAARALSQSLLPAKIRTRLAGWDAVHIVGSDLMGYVPFELLPLGPGPTDGTEDARVGDRLAVDYLPSIQVARFVIERGRARSARQGPDLALFAAPEIHPSVLERWPEALPIPFGAELSEPVRAPFQSVRVWSGPDATLQALAGGEVASAGMLHVITHGVEDPAAALPIGLVFAGEGDGAVAWHADLARLEFPSVVLITACQAGKTILRRGEDGVASLANAFLSGGADVVLLSPQRQELGHALAFAGVLSRGLTRGMTVAEALREARRNSVARGEHPFWMLVHAVGWGGAAPFRD